MNNQIAKWKQMYQTLKSELQEDFDQFDLGNDTFSFFFAGYIIGKKNNLDLLGNVLQTTKKIQQELNIKQKKLQIIPQESIEDDEDNSQQKSSQNNNSQQQKSLKGIFTNLVPQDQSKKGSVGKIRSIKNMEEQDSSQSSANHKSVSLMGQQSPVESLEKIQQRRQKEQQRKRAQQQESSIGNLKDLEDLNSMESVKRTISIKKSSQPADKKFLAGLFDNEVDNSGMENEDESQNKKLQKPKYTRDSFKRSVSPSVNSQQSQKPKIVIQKANNSSRSRSRSNSQERKEKRKYWGKNTLEVEGNSRQDRKFSSNSQSDGSRLSVSPDIDANNQSNLRLKALQRKRLLKEKLQVAELDEKERIANLSQQNSQNISETEWLEDSYNSNNNNNNNNNMSQQGNKKLTKKQQSSQSNKLSQQQQRQTRKQSNQIAYEKTLLIQEDNMEEEDNAPYDSNEEEEKIPEKKNQEQQKKKKINIQEFMDNKGKDSDESDNEYKKQLEAMKQYESEKEQERLSMELIQQLMQEEKSNQEQEIKKKQEKDAENNMCNICFGDLYEEDVMPLSSCEHIFHVSCLKTHIETLIKERKVEFSCPEDGCGQRVQVGDFKDVLDEKTYDKFLEFSLATFVDQNADEASWCPTPGCDFVFILEENKEDNQFKCEKCKKHYCLNCRVEYDKGHKGMTCKEFQISNKRDENDVKFDKYLKKSKCKQCPHCSFWVSKVEGCYKMTCKCGHTFCYVCGSATDGYHCPTCHGKKKAGGGGLFGGVAVAARRALAPRPRGGRGRGRKKR